MENTNEKAPNKQNLKSVFKLNQQNANERKINIFKWDQFILLKESGDSSNKYYTLNENKSISENFFFQSKANSNYVFISNK